MRIDELAWVCQEAARDLVANHTRPLPAAVVLPGPRATRIVKLEGFPHDDDTRAAVLADVARDEMLATSTPAYGFLAEAEVGGGEGVVVVFGAQGHHPQVTAAFFADHGLGEFAQPEPLAPGALGFIRPLQHAAEQVREPPT